jgi:hypothetical protein
MESIRIAGARRLFVGIYPYHTMKLVEAFTDLYDCIGYLDWVGETSGEWCGQCKYTICIIMHVIWVFQPPDDSI